MKIAMWALLFAVIWLVALNVIARSPGLHSTQGMWAGALGFPGVIVASWVRPWFIHHNPHDEAGRSVMFIVNWMFYCTVLQGLILVRESFRK